MKDSCRPGKVSDSYNRRPGENSESKFEKGLTSIGERSLTRRPGENSES